MPHSTSDNSCDETSMLRASGSLAAGKRKVAFFQTPVIQRQPVAVPPQQLDAIAAATAKHEQVARERIASPSQSRTTAANESNPFRISVGCMQT